MFLLLRRRLSRRLRSILRGNGVLLFSRRLLFVFRFRLWTVRLARVRVRRRVRLRFLFRCRVTRLFLRSRCVKSLMVVMVGLRRRIRIGSGLIFVRCLVCCFLTCFLVNRVGVRRLWVSLMLVTRLCVLTWGLLLVLIRWRRRTDRLLRRFIRSIWWRPTFRRLVRVRLRFGLLVLLIVMLFLR